MKNAAMAVACTLAAATAAVDAGAAEIYLTPAVIAPSTQSTQRHALELFMDFASSEATLGGGIDLDATGVLKFVSFAPSSYFLTATDPAFTGHGTATADADYQIHFGNFNGLSGRNLLGVVTVDVAGSGGAAGALDLAVNTFWQGFDGVTLTGTVVAVPEPATVALWAIGLAAVAARAGTRAGERRRPG